jgi:hypothetical protein
MMNYFVWLIIVAAAVLEVGGDAVVRSGLRGRQVLMVLLGCALLGAYGVMVNTVRWDFSRLFGVYVACFGDQHFLRTFRLRGTRAGDGVDGPGADCSGRPGDPVWHQVLKL